MEKKKNLIILGVVLGIFLLIGATYAFFTYYRESDKVNELIAGEVYMKFVDGENTIGLINTFPETVEEARAREDNVITFTIDGKNTTTNKDIYYEIKLLYADDIQGKTRFLDKHLKFDLVETTNGVSEMVLNAVSYNEINNKRIWVNTINKNTITPIERTYQLRMWLSGDILISDTEDYADYTTDEFKNSYANVKVAVYGDFEWKEVAQDASCFAYNTVSNSISYNNLYYDLNTSSESVAICKDYMLNTVVGSDESDAWDGYQSYCNGSGSLWGNTFKEDIEVNNFTEEQITYFIDNNVLVQTDNPSFAIEITNYDVNTCGTDVAIPSYIEGYPVIGIGNEAFYGYGITSVRFPNTLEYIGDEAFRSNNITVLNIPNSVTVIYAFAFSWNPLVNVTVNGNSALLREPFIDEHSNLQFEIFKYGGTCTELNSYQNVFKEPGPNVIITSDNNACVFDNYYYEVEN